MGGWICMVYIWPDLGFLCAFDSDFCIHKFFIEMNKMFGCGEFYYYIKGFVCVCGVCLFYIVY